VTGRRRSADGRWGWTVLLLACLGVPPARAAVNVAILPASQVVPPGSQFEVTIQVTGASPRFNAFHVIVGYDPAALTPVPLSPTSLQLGALMTGACGSFFHVFSSGAGADSIDVSMLCPGVSVTGPGTLYRLDFKASSTAQATGLWVRPTPTLADSGVYLPGVAFANAVIGIGMSPPPAGVAPAPPAAGLRLAVGPNPARGGTLLSLAGAPAGAAVCVLDAQGRCVRRLAVPAGVGAVWWDGRSDAGASVPSGVYLAVALAGGRRAYARLVLTR